MPVPRLPIEKIPPPPNTEARLMQECYIFFHNNYPQYRGLLFRIVNESTSRITGARNKATGTVPGVSDMILLLPDSGGPIALEFKTAIGTQSETQSNWQRTIEKQGYRYYIIRSLEGFKKTLYLLL
jgi:hypothetical protein